MHIVIFGVRWPPETFIARRLEGLAAAGHRVTVASRSRDDARRPPNGVRHVPIEVSPVGLLVRGSVAFVRVLIRSPRRAWALLLAAGRRTPGGHRIEPVEAIGRALCFAQVAVLRPDVIHFEWTTTAVECFWLPRALGCPAVVSSHGCDVQMTPFSPHGRHVATSYPAVFLTAARIQADSHAVAAAATAFGALPGKVRVIHAGVDTEFFKPAARERDPNRFTLLTIATLRWVKGLEYALLTLAELVRRGVPATLDILGAIPDWGEPSEEEHVRSTARALGISERVRIVGFVSEEAVRDRLIGADALLQASLSEGHPTAVVEAMACGTPVVATDAGGTAEAIGGGAGILVPVRDWRAAAEALESLWRDPELAAELARRGRGRVEREFTLERHLVAFERFYAEALACS